jgi:hypothetical protein
MLTAFESPQLRIKAPVSQFDPEPLRAVAVGDTVTVGSIPYLVGFGAPKQVILQTPYLHPKP